MPLPRRLPQCNGYFQRVAQIVCSSNLQFRALFQRLDERLHNANHDNFRRSPPIRFELPRLDLILLKQSLDFF